MCSMWDADSDLDYYGSMLGVYPDDREPEEEEVNTVMEEVIINPAEHAQRLTTTLNRLRDAGACADRYGHLVKALGGVSFDHDAAINLLTILEHNGTEDCLWALRATIENCDKVARLMAADFAEAVLPIFARERPTDPRPREAINAARLFALGRTDSAAGAAAADAAWSAAEAAAWSAARDAGDSAAWPAAREAARDAAGETQANIIRRYLKSCED